MPFFIVCLQLRPLIVFLRTLLCIVLRLFENVLLEGDIGKGGFRTGSFVFCFLFCLGDIVQGDSVLDDLSTSQPIMLIITNTNCVTIKSLVKILVLLIPDIHKTISLFSIETW